MNLFFPHGAPEASYHDCICLQPGEFMLYSARQHLTTGT